jgi:hypothetical protein
MPLSSIDQWVQLSINGVLRRDCRLTPPQTRGSRSAFAVVSQPPAMCVVVVDSSNGEQEGVQSSMHGIALQVIRSPVHHLRVPDRDSVNSKSLMNLEAVRGLNAEW